MFDIIKPIEKPASAVAVFAMVANERDLLPHFLAHYRQLGIDEFHFLVDKSSDGTQEWLMTQQDCAVMTCRYKFGDDVELEYMGQPHKGRFANMARGAAARTFMMGRWCLILDADEFLVLPEDVPDIPAWTRLLDNMQLDCCRALMVDYFPEQLQDLNHADAAMSPFDIAPFYDSLSWDWASDSNAPNQISYERAVRARIAKRLLELYPDHTEIALGVPKMLFKTPLIKVHPDTHMFNPHQCNHLSSDKIQVALAHFKFLPGWQAKVNEAVDQKQYVNGSIKYVPLKLAANDLTNWPLRGSHSVDSRITPLSQSEMVFNHLPTQPSIKHHRAAKRPVPKPIIWKEPNRKNLSPLHIANRGARNSTVTGVAWIDEYRLVANHRDGMRVALFDVRKGESPLAVADLPNLNDDVAVWSLGDGSWEVVISDCWHGLYTKLRLTLEPEPVFERLTTQWNNRKTFSHGVNYDSQGQLWLALMTGMDPRIEIDGGGGVWRLPRPWGCRQVCFDYATGNAYAIAVSNVPQRAEYSDVKLRIYTMVAGSTTWSLFEELTNVHSDAGAVYKNILWITDQYEDRVLGLKLTENSPKQSGKPNKAISIGGKLFSFPHGIAISSDGLMAVTNYGTSSISFVDLNEVL